MKKLIGLFHYQSNASGDFYNFYPIKVLTDTYGEELKLSDIEWGTYIDPEIGDVVSQYKNININFGRMANNGDDLYNDARETFWDYTWGVLDVEFLKRNVKTLRGNNKYIPFITLYDEKLNISDNGCSIILGRNEVDYDFYRASVSFDYDERFYIRETDRSITGPYIKNGNNDYDRTPEYALWKLDGDVSFLYCDIYNGNQSDDSYSLQILLNSQLVRVERPSNNKAIESDETIKQAEESASSEVVPNADEKIEAAQIEEVVENVISTADEVSYVSNNAETPITDASEITSSYAPGSFLASLETEKAYYPEDNLDVIITHPINLKESRECKSKEFKKDLESKYSGINRVIFKNLYAFNSVSVEMIDSELPKKEKNSSEVALERLVSLGYLNKVSLNTFGDYFYATKRGLTAFKFEQPCNYLGVKWNREPRKDDKLVNLNQHISRFVYSKIVKDIHLYSDTVRASVGIYGDSYLMTFSNKDNYECMLLGVFDVTGEKLAELEKDITESLSTRKNISRIIIGAVNKAQAAALVKAFIDSFKHLFETPKNIFVYCFEDEKYFEPYGFIPEKEGKERYLKDITADDIWDESVDNNFVKALESVIAEETAKANREKQIEEEQKRAEAEKLVRKRREEEQAALNELISRKKLLQEEVYELEHRKDLIKKSEDAAKANVESLTKQAGEIVRNAKKAIENPEFARVTIDGYLASHMMKAAGEWESNEKTKNYEQYSKDILALEEDQIDSVRDYVVEKIKKARPTYSHNEIANIAMCIAQGFLTVFSGAPGSGKTSICNLFARILGLDMPFAEYEYLRYVPISVGRGWTSQRDFIGYYNPLSKEFDTNNNQAFDIFKIGDEEYENSKYPLVVMLDEANLSPMEYYWSEFIRMCDDRSRYNTINCGGKETFKIPETMRFLATINNDDTTTTLSPRLIDRAWIVTLPKLNPEDLLERSTDFEEGELKRVTWAGFIDAFGPKETTEEDEQYIMELLKAIVDIVPGLNINNRVYTSMRDYFSAAKHCFTGSAANSDALDYAIAQRILPKIGGVDGQGDTYGRQLKNLQEYLLNNNYRKSADLVREIVERGSDIGYYQFF